MVQLNPDNEHDGPPNHESDAGTDQYIPEQVGAIEKDAQRGPTTEMEIVVGLPS